MDDREFSSPVCYLDYDHHEERVATPTQPAFCKTCTAFISAPRTNPNEDETNLDALSSEKKLKFVLNKDDWIYKTEENIVETAAEGCPLCVVILRGLGLEDRERLMGWEELHSILVKDGTFIEFTGELRDDGIAFRLILPKKRVDSVLEKKGWFSHDFGKGKADC
jgi:hypothetical protein